MTDAMVIAFFLNFTGVSGTIIRRAGYDNISPVSRTLCIPLILGGIIASFLAIYCTVKTEGWLVGLAIWFASGLVLAWIASAIRARWDGVLSIAALFSLLVGTYLFWVRFL
jgi:hypothetical protein